jgi:hypothetical protein
MSSKPPPSGRAKRRFAPFATPLMSNVRQASTGHGQQACFAIWFLAANAGFAQSHPPIDESSAAPAKLGYPTVAAALEGLRARPGVSVSTTKPDGWIIVTETSTKAVWSFTPDGHYAYPAVVRREVKQRDGGEVYIDMVALCQAAKEPCDRLIREFRELNDQMRANMQRGASGQQRR